MNSDPPKAAKQPPKSESPVAQALDTANRHLRAGRLGAAKAMYQDILLRHPRNAGALHFLGLAASQEGHLERAVDLMSKAIDEDRTIPFFHTNLAEIYRRLGRLDEAIAVCRRALDLYPVNPDALNTLGAAFHARGELDEAERALREALEFKPDLAMAHANLGNVLIARGKGDEAIESYRGALALQPNNVGVLNNLGNALAGMGRGEEAVETFRQALKLAPQEPAIWSNVGTTLMDLGRSQEAVEAFRKAVEIRPGLTEVHRNLALALFAQGKRLEERGEWAEAEKRYRDALAHDPEFLEAQNNLGTSLLGQGRYRDAQAAFHRHFESKRGPVLKSADGPPAGNPRAQEVSVDTLRTTRFKLVDQAEQLERLLAQGLVDSSFTEAVARYRSVIDELGAGDDEEITLTPDQVQRISAYYSRVLYYADAPRVRSGAVNDSLDFGQIEDRYLSSPAAVVHFDGLLSPEALARLREFCLDSTIFFRCDPTGFVASYMSDGFNGRLVYQIAEELARRLPRVLGPQFLNNMWIYRHRNRGEGVAAHTDEAAVTLNFWLTPDGANLAPERGGLVLYQKEQPPDWDWKEYNEHRNRPYIRKRVAKFLDSATRVTIPYRENRAVLFHSNLFHKSDEIRFKDGLQNRRMNVTMLYGRRDGSS